MGLGLCLKFGVLGWNSAKITDLLRTTHVVQSFQAFDEGPCECPRSVTIND